MKKIKKMSRFEFVSYVLRSVRNDIRLSLSLYPNRDVCFSYDLHSDQIRVDFYDWRDGYPFSTTFAKIYLSTDFTPYQLYMSIRNCVLLSANGWLYKSYCSHYKSYCSQLNDIPIRKKRQKDF